jgi:hypothetical protein
MKNIIIACCQKHFVVGKKVEISLNPTRSKEGF